MMIINLYQRVYLKSSFISIVVIGLVMGLVLDFKPFFLFKLYHT